MDVSSELETRIAQLEHALAVAEAKLGEQRLQCRAIIESVPVGVAVTDIEGRTRFANSAMEGLAGRLPASSEGGPFDGWHAAHADGRPVAADECPLNSVLQGGVAHSQLDVLLQTPPGARRWVRIVAELILDGRGNRIGAVITCLDVNDRRELEVEKHEAIRELNHRVRNGFGVLNAIVSRSLRAGSIDPDIRHAISVRLATYAAAFERANEQVDGTVELHDLSEIALADMDPASVTIEGEPVSLPARYSVPVALAFLELARASARARQGSAKLHWRAATTTDKPPILRITFQHLSRNTPGDPQFDQFASFVVNGGLSAETGAAIETKSSADGWMWQADIPLPCQTR